MPRGPPSSTRTYTPFPDPTLFRSGAARPSREAVRGTRLRAARMVGARLERAVDRILQGTRRTHDGRMDGDARRRRRAGAPRGRLPFSSAVAPKSEERRGGTEGDRKGNYRGSPGQ